MSTHRSANRPIMQFAQNPKETRKCFGRLRRQSWGEVGRNPPGRGPGVGHGAARPPLPRPAIPGPGGKKRGAAERELRARLGRPAWADQIISDRA